MKTLRIFGIMLISVLLFSFTNKDKLSSYLEELKRCETTTQYFELAEQFGAIQVPGNQDWYPDYYAAYSYTLSAFAEKDYSKIDEKLDLAQQYIDKAQQISPKNDEILCVASMIYSARIMVNPQERGYKYGQKSGILLEKALLLNSDNPRTLFLIGQSKMYMPVNYGGGCENAKPILEKSLEKFESFEKPHVNYPDWGKEEAQELLNNCS